MRTPSRRGWVVATTFGVALILTALPLPDVALFWRPAWVLMALLYWAMALPERVGIISGWVLGLLLDVMYTGILGQHALAYGLAVFFVVGQHRQLRVFPLGQQAVIIGVVIFLATALIHASQYLFQQPAHWQAVVYGSLTSALLWPWFFVLMRDIRRHANLS